MKFPYCAPISIAVLTSLAIGSHAQSLPPETDPTAPSLNTVQPVYQSVFEQYRFAPELKQTPDQLWRAANDELGALKGHADHIKDVPLNKDIPRDTPAKSATSIPYGGHGEHGMHHAAGDKP